MAKDSPSIAWGSKKLSYMSTFEKPLFAKMWHVSTFEKRN